MKKIFLILIALFFAAVIFAQTSKYTEIKVSALPKNATTWIKKNLPDATILHAGVTTENNQTIYLTQLSVKGDKRIVRFDKNGNFLGKGVKDQDKNSAKPVPVKK